MSSAPTSEAPRQRIVIPERHKLQLNNTARNAAQAAKNAENLANQPAVKNAATLVKNTPVDSTANATVVCGFYVGFLVMWENLLVKQGLVIIQPVT